VWKRKYLVSACTDSAAAVESDAAGVTGKEWPLLPHVRNKENSKKLKIYMHL
jgi:hypothetical protein